jgi:preprotein translocase subunit SecE
MAKDKKNKPTMKETREKMQKRQQGRSQNAKRQRGSFIEYLKNVRLEMRKVVWPTKQELWQYAALVVVACAFFAVAFWAIDTGFLALLKQLLGISM